MQSLLSRCCCCCKDPAVEAPDDKASVEVARIARPGSDCEGAPVMEDAQSLHNIVANYREDGGSAGAIGRVENRNNAEDADEDEEEGDEEDKDEDEEVADDSGAYEGMDSRYTVWKAYTGVFSRHAMDEGHVFVEEAADEAGKPAGQEGRKVPPTRRSFQGPRPADQEKIMHELLTGINALRVSAEDDSPALEICTFLCRVAFQAFEEKSGTRAGFQIVPNCEYVLTDDSEPPVTTRYGCLVYQDFAEPRFDSLFEDTALHFWANRGCLLRNCAMGLRNTAQNTADLVLDCGFHLQHWTDEKSRYSHEIKYTFELPPEGMEANATQFLAQLMDPRCRKVGFYCARPQFDYHLCPGVAVVAIFDHATHSLSASD